MTSLDRRTALTGLGVMATMGFAAQSATQSAQGATTGDVGADPFTTFMKMYSNLEPGEHWWWFMGHWDIIVPGRTPVTVVGHDTLIRRIVTKDGNGVYTQRGWEGMIAWDLKTREPVDRMVNPVTGRVVYPYHTKEGPINTVISQEGIHLGAGSANARILSIDLPKTVAADDIWMQRDYRYAGPHAMDANTWRLENSGDKNWTNMETIYRAKLSDVRNPDLSTVDTDYMISGESVVLPWLAMGPDLAFLGWTGFGKKLMDPSGIPSKNLKWFEQRHPELFSSGEPWQDYSNVFYGYMTDRKPLEL